MPYSLTFHIQIEQDQASQETAESLRMFFARPEVEKALDDWALVHYGRILLIPNKMNLSGEKGIHAIQVIIVYDERVPQLLQFFWKDPEFRSLFQKLSGIAKRSMDTSELAGFIEFVKGNNLNPKEKELRPSYDVTVKEIWKKFYGIARAPWKRV